MAKSKTETKSFFMNTLNRIKQKPTIGKTACLLLALTALPFFFGCKSAELKEEPQWTDFYEVKSYEVESVVITNEITTTVFIAKYVETNEVKSVQKTIVESVGDGLEESIITYTPNNQTPEFQCVGNSCGVKEK